MDNEMKRSIILDNYSNARNRGIPDNQDDYVVINSNNQSCIDNINIYVKLNGNNYSFVSSVQDQFALQASNGTNLAYYFSKVYSEKTGHKVIVVLASRGGERIAHFLPHNRVLEEAYSTDNAAENNKYIYEKRRINKKIRIY